MADLALGILGGADVGLKWGARLYELFKSLKNAPAEIQERTLRVESCWMKISKQLDLTRTMVNALDDEHRHVHHMATTKTLEKLQCVYDELLSISNTIKPELAGNGSSNGNPVHGIRRARAKYALRKQQLDDAITELESWQRIHDNSWLLILNIARTITGREPPKPFVGNTTSPAAPGTHISRDSFLPIAVLHSAITTQINRSDALVATIGKENFIVDTFACVRPPRGILCPVSRDVRSLVKKFHNNDVQRPGILRCKGAMKDETENITQFSLLFRFPPHASRPKCLREVLQSSPQPSLSDIVKIGQHIAEAISFIHISGFVHKNVRPETILVYGGGGIGSPSAFLVGFEKFRVDGGMTAKLGDNSWDRNIYRHPERCGMSLSQVYVMQHDIYSLGVCLLEIGLWQSFVGQDGAEPGFDSFLKSLGILRQTSSSVTGIDFKLVKSGLVSLAESRLPSRAGTLYTNVVKTCLTCLDAENDDFGDESEFLDSDGILVGIRYIEKVLLRLRAICI